MLFLSIYLFLLKVMRIPTLETLPEDQFQQLTAGGEMRVGVRHRVSIRLQVEDAHCCGRHGQWSESNNHSAAETFFSPHTTWVTSPSHSSLSSQEKGTWVDKRSQASCCFWGGGGNRASDGCIQSRSKCIEPSLLLLLTFEGAEERLLRCHVEPRSCAAQRRCFTTHATSLLSSHGAVMSLPHSLAWIARHGPLLQDRWRRPGWQSNSVQLINTSLTERSNG